MTQSNITNSPFIGLKNFHIAELKSDNAGAEPVYDTVISIPHIRSIQIKASNANASLYADNQAIDSASVTSEYELTIETATLPLEYKALLLGHHIENGVMVANKDDVAPYFAIAFESTKRNGKRRFCKFLKVQFSEPDENPKTKGENIDYNTPTLSCKAIYRTADGVAYKQADEEAGYTEETANAWYTEV